MHGNVAEWCQDYFSATYYQQSPASDPAGAATGVNRVVRGGSWNGPPSRCRSAARFSEPPARRRKGFDASWQDTLHTFCRELLPDAATFITATRAKHTRSVSTRHGGRL